MQSPFRTILLAGLTVSAVFSSAQDLNAKFTFSSSAMTAPKLLENMSKVAGVRLSGGNKVKDDVLCVRFTDVTVQQAMEKIAEAASAEWQSSDGGYILTRTGATLLKLQREEDARRGKKLDEAIKKQLAEIEKTPKMTEEEAQKLAQQSRQQLEALNRSIRDGAGGQTGLALGVRSFGGMQKQQPAARAIIRILAKMNVNDLAALGPSTRTVYALKPTSMQKALPGAAVGIIDSFLEEQRTMAQAAPAGGQVTGFLGGAVGFTSEGAQASPQLQNARPGKALMIVTRMGMGDGLQIELKVADAQTGQFYASGMTFLMPDMSFVKTGGSTGTEEPIKFSTLSKELAKLLGGPASGVQAVAGQFIALTDGATDLVFTGSPAGVGSSKPVELTPEWRDRILHPEDFESLSTAPSDIFDGIAGQRKKNLVALLPDSCLLPTLRRCDKGNLLPSEALQMADVELDLNVNETDAWILVSPRKAATAINERVDRKALGKMLRTLDKNGRLTLDDLAAYATTTEASYVSGGLDFSYLRLLDPVVADRQFRDGFQGNREMLQFYGYLGASNRDSLIAGRPMGLNSLSQKQRELVHSMVYNSMDGPTIGGPGGGPGGPPGMAMMMGRGNLQTERTEALPNGVPSNGFLTLRGNREEAVLATDAEGGNAQVLTADALGRSRAMAANVRGDFAFGVNFEKYRLGEQTTMNFIFALQRGINLTRRLTDDKVDRKATPVAWDALPADFRRRADQAAQRMQRGMRGAGGGVAAPAGDGR